MDSSEVGFKLIKQSNIRIEIHFATATATARTLTVIVYFDSYGLAPAFVGLESYMDTYFLAGWIYNRKTLQALFSNVCGHYCVYYILFRCRYNLCMLLYLILRLT